MTSQDDPDRSERDFTGEDLALEYCWRTLDAIKMLTDFGTKRLPGEAATEDGSPPADDGGGDVRADEDTMDLTVAAAPAPKCRRSAQYPATNVPPSAFTRARDRGRDDERGDEDPPRHLYILSKVLSKVLSNGESRSRNE